MCERGVQLRNPFYSIWATEIGTNLALAFIILAGVCAGLYFCFLSYMIWKVSCARLLRLVRVKMGRVFLMVYICGTRLFLTVNILQKKKNVNRKECLKKTDSASLCHVQLTLLVECEFDNEEFWCSARIRYSWFSF